MAPSRNESPKPSAQLSPPPHHHTSTKIKKGKQKKCQRQATKMLQKTLHNLHAPTAGQHYRKAARRWLQSQKESKLIPGRIAQELFLFIQERPIGGRKRWRVEREDLSAEAEAVWGAYLGGLALSAGDEGAVGRNRAAVVAVVAARGVGGGEADGGDAVDAVGGDEGEGDDVIILSPELHVAKEGADALASRWVGDLVMLGPKPRQGERGDVSFLAE